MIDQVMILSCGLLTVFFSTSLDARYRKAASPIGLLGQPFWFHAAYINEAWGIFLLTMVYAARWAQVFYRDWIKGR